MDPFPWSGIGEYPRVAMEIYVQKRNAVYHLPRRRTKFKVSGMRSVKGYFFLLCTNVTLEITDLFAKRDSPVLHFVNALNIPLIWKAASLTIALL